MPEAKPLVLDAIREDKILQVFPRLPLLSSHKLGWEGISVQYYRQPAWEIPEHANPQHVINIHHDRQVINAERMLDGRRERAQLGDGDITLIPANVQRKSCWDKEIIFTYLVLEPTHIPQIAHEFVDADKVELVPQFLVRDPLIYQIGLALKSELESDGLGTRLYAESMATALWAHLLKKYSTQPLRESVPSVGNNQLQPAIEFINENLDIEYINENLDRDLKLAEIAAVVNMSQYYFARMFKQHIGIAPHQYVVGQRMKKAKQLLTANNQLSIAEVAYRVGFSNQSYFTAQFRKATGTTPKGYRNSL